MNDVEKVFTDLDDEITFVVERVRSTDKKKILLIVPDRASLISSIVSLKLLFRYCFKNNKALVLVTNDELGLSFAKKAGIVAVSKVSEVDEILWERAEQVSSRASAAYKSTGFENIKKVQEVNDTNSSQEDLSKKEELEPIQDLPLDNKEQEPAEIEQVIKEGDKSEIKDVAINKESKLETSPDITPIKEEKVVTPQREEKKVEIQNVGGFEFVAGGDIAEVLTKEALKKPQIQVPPAVSEQEPKRRFLQKKVSVVDTSKSLEQPETPKPQIISKKRVSGGSSLVGRDISSYKFKRTKPQRTKRKNPFSGKFGTKKAGTSNIPKFKLNIKFTYLIPVLAIIIGGLIYTYIYVPKAQVDLTFASEQIAIEKDIKASPDVTESDIEKLVVPATIVEADVNSSKSGTATGTKQIGEVAKGELTLLNQTDTDVTLPAGTIVTASTKNFTTDIEITIPARDEDLGTYGARDVFVTATSFGEEYNIAKGVEFTVSGYGTDQVKGKIFGQSFAGGTSKTIKVISSEDIEKIKQELLTELREKAITQLKQNIGEGSFYNEKDIKFEEKDTSSVPVVGTEAESFDVSVRAIASVTVFDNEKLNALAKELLNSQVSEGYTLDEDSIVIENTYKKADGTSIIVGSSIKAYMIKDFDTNSFANEIRGKGVGATEEVINNQTEVEDYKIEIAPSWLFGPFKHVPRNTKKIDINVTSQIIEETPAETTKE